MKKTDLEKLWAYLENMEVTPYKEGEKRLGLKERLAREHGWNIQYAEDAIEEYKKFVYLACVCPHPVSPSYTVDQVWHMHLIFSEHYHEEMNKALPKPLHHGPTKGKQENGKFTDLYQKTYESYKEKFGEPPVEFWPRPGTRFNEPTRTMPWSEYERLKKERFQTGIAYGFIVGLGMTIISALIK